MNYNHLFDLGSREMYDLQVNQLKLTESSCLF